VSRAKQLRTNTEKNRTADEGEAKMKANVKELSMNEMEQVNGGEAILIVMGVLSVLGLVGIAVADAAKND
jgi:bacteriocin-like protein